MPPFVAVIIIIIATLGALYLILTWPGRKRQNEWVAGLNWEVLLSPEVQACLPYNKAEAIKIYQERTNVGLQEAMAAVEYAAAHPEPAPSMRVVEILNKVRQESNGLRNLLREGKRDEALKTYQALTGVDQFEANKAVNALEEDIRMEAARYDEHGTGTRLSEQKG